MVKRGLRDRMAGLHVLLIQQENSADVIPGKAGIPWRSKHIAADLDWIPAQAKNDEFMVFLAGSITRAQCLVVAVAFIPAAIRQGNADVLHHSLVFMVQDVAVQYKVTDVALITGAHDQCVLAGRLAGRHQVFHP